MVMKDQDQHISKLPHLPNTSRGVVAGFIAHSGYFVDGHFKRIVRANQRLQSPHDSQTPPPRREISNSVLHIWHFHGAMPFVLLFIIICTMTSISCEPMGLANACLGYLTVLYLTSRGQASKTSLDAIVSRFPNCHSRNRDTIHRSFPPARVPT